LVFSTVHSFFLVSDVFSFLFIFFVFSFVHFVLLHFLLFSPSFSLFSLCFHTSKTAALGAPPSAAFSGCGPD